MKHKRVWIVVFVGFTAWVLAVIAHGHLTGVGDAGFLLTDDGKPIHHDPMDLPLQCGYEPTVPLKLVTAWENAAAWYEQQTGIRYTHPCVRWPTGTRPERPGKGFVRLKVRHVDGPGFGAPAVSVGPQGEHGGTASNYFDVRTGVIVQGSVVAIDDDMPPEVTDGVARHEYGHMVGLAHDEYPGSIMVPGNTSLVLDGLTTPDVKRLKKMYGHLPVTWQFRGMHGL